MCIRDSGQPDMLRLIGHLYGRSPEPRTRFAVPMESKRPQRRHQLICFQLSAIRQRSCILHPHIQLFLSHGQPRNFQRHPDQRCSESPGLGKHFRFSKPGMPGNIGHIYRHWPEPGTRSAVPMAGQRHQCRNQLICFQPVSYTHPSPRDS